MPVRDIETEKKLLAKEYKELLKISYQSLNKEDKKLIRKAFDYAVDAHQYQRRENLVKLTYSIQFQLLKLLPQKLD